MITHRVDHSGQCERENAFAERWVRTVRAEGSGAETVVGVIDLREQDSLLARAARHRMTLGVDDLERAEDSELHRPVVALGNRRD